MTVQCGATEFCWLPGFSRHTWPTAAADRRGSHLFNASHKCGRSDHPARAWPTPRLPRDRPAGRAGAQRVAPAADTRTREVVAGRRPPPRPFRESGRGRPGPTGGQRGPPRRRGRAEPGRPQQVRRGRPPAPPAARPAFTCSGGSRARGRRPGPGRPSPPGRPSSPDARTDGPPDASGWRRGGPAGPRPEGPGTGPAGGLEGCRGGRDRPTGPQGQSLQRTTGPPPSLGAPGDARALTVARVSSRLLVPPSRRLSGPSSPPSGLSRQPERRLPRTRGVRRGGGGAAGSALGGPGAAEHGAPE